MLSYQHIYHAGCLADIHKHSVLALFLSRMREKPKPLSYIETHAGRGLYDVYCPEAEKTGEAKAGILKLLNNKTLPKEHPYTKVINETIAKYGENYYSGSPFIAKSILNRDDKLHLMEMHPQEYIALKSNINDKRINIHNGDGYKISLDISPPQPRRGLAFIDPSYEIKAEYENMAHYISKLYKKWAEAVILIWYPILKAGNHNNMTKQIQNLNLPKFWQQEVIFPEGIKHTAMLGSGLICINTPFGIDAELKEISDWFCINSKF